MKKILALVLVLAMALALVACGGGKTATSGKIETIADVWPDGTTVYIDVPAKAGGGTDLFTRYLTAALGKYLPKVNFVVTNYDTAEVGAEHAKNAKPDGKTLTVAACTNMDNYLSGMSNVNPNEMTIIGKMHDGGPQAIIAKPDAPYTNLVEWGQYINEHPGEVVVGCSLGGTSQIILYSIIDAVTGGNADAVNYVQCGSEADKLTQTASASIDIANCSIPNAQAYEADGKLTILGTIGPKVATLETMSKLVGLELPQTFLSTVEQGIDFTWNAGYYLIGPAGMSEEMAKVINEAMVAACADQEFLDGMGKMASFPNVTDLATTRADWKAEWDFQNEILTSLGWKAEGR